MIKITIDGIEYEVPQQVAQAFNKYDADMKKKVLDAEEATTKAEKEKDEAEKEKEDAEKEAEKAKGTADGLKKDILDDDALAKLVSDKAELVSVAREILGSKYDESTKDCGTCDTKLKAAVIDHVMKDTDLSGKSDDYISAMFDVAVSQSAKASKSLDALGTEIVKDKDGNEVTRDSARAKWMKDHLNMEGN